MRLRNNPEAVEIVKLSERNISKFPYKIRPNSILEIGMGKGDMIVKLAEKNKNMNYIGLEKYATVAERALRKADEIKLSNFNIICDDAERINEYFIGTFDVIWLTFSDPWPKVRHEKRRLTSKSFLEKYKMLMNDNSIIRLKTDNDKFFEYSVKSLKTNGFKLSNVTTNFHESGYHPENEMTDYEKKWSAKGKNINYLEARK